MVDGRRWVLLGDRNAHHRSWSLEGKEDSVGRVLAEWVEEMGAEVKFGGGATFMRGRLGSIVRSRIDFMVVGGGAWVHEEASEWGVSDHAMVGGVVEADLEETVKDV